ncbi:probable serine/threonine-protein kinase yakA [Ceratitis capitata]|nr:probable serine/threonine-protein kinase yakA [Ceratitis capitata]
MQALLATPTIPNHIKYQQHNNSLKNIFASATLPRSAGSSIRSVLSAQAVHRSTGNGLDRDDDRDPRDVTNNSFNRFDPKYISIGPKAVRGNNNLNIVAAATANKCATLRHVGRYGGSLKGASPSPNLRSAKTPSIATVSKDYCQQPDCIPQTYTTEVIVPHQTQQQQPPPPPAPLPPPKPRTTNTFTEIPGTTGQQQQQQLAALQAAAAQQQQQQQQQAQAQLQMQQQQQQPTLHQQLHQHHPPTTHILPPTAVYSIETSGYQPQTQPQPSVQAQQMQQHMAVAQQQPPPPTAAPREPPRPPPQRSLNPSSIVNQPLPEIPQQAQQSKISPQPLCAANLNQYRSLQRPQAQKMQLPTAAMPPAQQQQHQQQPPLPPKKKTSREISTSTAGGTLNANHLQTLPPKSASLRQQQTATNAYSYERERERERERAERHERPRRAETLDNARTSSNSAGMAYIEQQFGGSGGVKKQHSYDSYTLQQQQAQRHATATTPNNNYHGQQQQQQYLIEAQQQQLYYRSLKRGGSHANNDLYSVTEL